MSDTKSIQEALAEVQRKVNEQRAEQTKSDWENVNEFAVAGPLAGTAARFGAKQMLGTAALAGGAAAAASPKVRKFVSNALGTDKTPEQSSASLNAAGKKISDTVDSVKQTVTGQSTPATTPEPKTTTSSASTSSPPKDLPVSAVRTKTPGTAGLFPVYQKSSGAAQSFRAAYRNATQNTPGGKFTWTDPSGVKREYKAGGSAPKPTPTRPTANVPTPPSRPAELTKPKVPAGPPAPKTDSVPGGGSTANVYPAGRSPSDTVPPILQDRGSDPKATPQSWDGVRYGTTQSGVRASGSGAVQRAPNSEKFVWGKDRPTEDEAQGGDKTVYGGYQMDQPRPPKTTQPETESGGKRKKMSEENNTLIAAFLDLQAKNPANMFEAAKKAKKDYDKDGKIESEKDEVWGSRFRAAKAAGKMEEGMMDPNDPSVQGSGDVTSTPAKKVSMPKPTAPKTDSSVQGSGDVTKDGKPTRVREAAEKITHIVAKADLDKHRKWMDSEGYGDFETRKLPVDHPKSATHVGIVSTAPNEAGYHEDGWAHPLKEGKTDGSKMTDQDKFLHGYYNLYGREPGFQKSDKLAYSGNTKSDDMRKTKSGKIYSQDQKSKANMIKGRLGKHPAPNLPEENENLFSEAEMEHLNRFFLEASVAPNRPEVAIGADSTSDKMSQNDVTGTSTESGKRKVKEETDAEDETNMAKTQLSAMAAKAKNLHSKLKTSRNLPAWVQSKLAVAKDKMTAVDDYMTHSNEKIKEETEIDEAMGASRNPAVAYGIRKTTPKNYEPAAGGKTYRGGIDKNVSPWMSKDPEVKLAWLKKRKAENEAKANLPENIEQIEEGRPKKNPTPETMERDPRKHIQVEAGRAAAGNVVDFHHNDGSKSKITPAMGRRIVAHLQGLKPADRQSAVNKMHDSAEGLKV